MRAPMKATVLLVSAILVLGTFGLASGQAVFVDVNEVGGLVDGMIPETGCDLVVPVRFTNEGEARTAISNGFYFASDAVTFGAVSGAWNPAYPWDWPMAIALGIYTPYFDQGLFTNLFDDGVGFAGLTGAAGIGLPVGFDGIAYHITVPGVSGAAGDVLTMDSTWWAPANYWLWSGVAENVAWGGPYDFVVDGYIPPPEPYTDCWPQPSILKALENDRILEFRLYNEDVANVDLTSLVVGNIPPYTGVTVVDDVITTDAFIMRFLGSSGFRPIPPEGIQSTYTLHYSYIDGTPAEDLIGDFVMSVYQGDVTLDGLCDINDVIFMTEYFFAGGQVTQMQGEKLYELMDVDGNGQPFQRTAR